MSPDVKLVVKGLAGKKTLKGEIDTPGAKNAILKVLAASLLFKDEVTVTNVPEIEDVTRMIELLEDLGVIVERKNNKTYRLITKDINQTQISPEISKHLRASLVLTGPLVARLGKVSFPHPGGCVIGKRPIDLTTDGFKALGASLADNGEHYLITAPKGGLKGTNIFFKNPSVTTTENFMMAGVLAKGVTVLENAVMEPEVVSLGEFLNKCGAKITGLGTPTISIKGGGLLSGKNKKYVTMPDRIVAGSFVVLGVLGASDLKVTNCDPCHLGSLINILESAGVKLEIGKNFIRIKEQKNKFSAVDIKTHEYPGFPTDLQAPLAVFLTQAVGQSFLFETIFEGRLNYLETLARMGADTKILDAHRAIITGPKKLTGKSVESPDLRAGLAYLLAAIIASGESVVSNVYYIDRGYEKIDEKLRAIGVNIERVEKKD